MAFIETTLPGNSGTNFAGSLHKEEYPYIGSQTFTTVLNYSTIYSVEVTGVGALSESQYTLNPPRHITINDALETGDFVVIIYGQANTGVAPYYTIAETDEFLEGIEDEFVRDAKIFYHTGIASKKDSFELVVFDLNTVTIKACDEVIFSEELYEPDATTEDAARSFPQINYPLSQLITATGGNVNTNPIVADGIYVRYLGYDKDGNVYSSANNFVENPLIAQLGLVTVIKSGVTIEFLGGITPGARNVFSVPILAGTDDLQRSSTKSSTTVTIGYNIGAPSLYSNSGVITGLSINWKGLTNPFNTSSIDKFNYSGDNIVDFVSITPLFLQMSTPPVIHTLWTELESSIAINNSFFNTTTQLRDTLTAGAFGIKRILIGLKGGFFIQESEFATTAGYTTIDQAKANIYTHTFTDSIVPPDVVIEIARIIFQKGVTDFSDSSKFFIVSTAGGVGSGGGIVTVGDATTSTKGVLKLAGDLSGTADLPTVPGLASKETISNKVDAIVGSSSIEYPTENAVVNYVGSGLSGKEDVANKTTSIETNKNSSTKYPTVKAIHDWTSYIQTTVISGTTHTLVDANNNKQLIFTNSAAITLTIPTGLTSGFNCEIVQQGTGQITATTSGTTLRYTSFEFPITAEQYAIAAIDNVVNLTETYRIYGQLQNI